MAVYPCTDIDHCLDLEDAAASGPTTWVRRAVRAVRLHRNRTAVLPVGVTVQLTQLHAIIRPHVEIRMLTAIAFKKLVNHRVIVRV